MLMELLNRAAPPEVVDRVRAMVEAELAGLPIDQLEPGADLHLATYADLALIAGGQKFSADHGQKKQTAPEHGGRNKYGDHTMRQHLANQVDIGVVKPCKGTV